MTPRILFSEAKIAARVKELAGEIAALPDLPDIATPVLAGAFVFAADLLRALAARGQSLPVEFMWLRSYAGARNPSDHIAVLAKPGESVRTRHVLLIDGVLDHGRTLECASRLLREAGARRVTTAVAIDKRLSGARLRADYAAFVSVNRFVVGYGMDDRGSGRGLPYIGALD